jgi:hypothetical protein
MFSFYKLPGSYQIASTNKKRKVYFLPEINIDIDQLKEDLIEENNISNLSELKQILTGDFISNKLVLQKDEEFFPVPHFEKRTCLMVIGNSGSGKSVFISRFIKKYEKIFKENELFLLSNKAHNEEPAFENISNLKYIPINSLNEAINVKKFERCLFIYDDIHEGVILDSDSVFVKSLEKEKYSTQQRIIKERQKQLDNIIDKSSINMLSLGRSRNISIVIVKHAFRDGKNNLYKTEGTHLCTFPSGNSAKIKEYLKNVECLSKTQIYSILNLKESKSTYQFLYISRQGLRYCISNKNIISLDLED